MCIGGGHPNDTNHTLLRPMKFQNYYSSKFKGLLGDFDRFAIKSPNQELAKQIEELPLKELGKTKEISSKEFCATTQVPDFDYFFYNHLNEQDAELVSERYHLDVEGNVLTGHIDINEKLIGSSTNDYITINQRDISVAPLSTSFGMFVDAGEGNDFIVDHSEAILNPMISQAVGMRGGRGMDTFVSTGQRAMAYVNDIEIGEKFIVHSSYQIHSIRVMDEIDGEDFAGKKSISLRNDLFGEEILIDDELWFYNWGHSMIIPENTTLEESMIDGFKAFTVVPES